MTVLVPLQFPPTHRRRNIGYESHKYKTD